MPAEDYVRPRNVTWTKVGNELIETESKYINDLPRCHVQSTEDRDQLLDEPFALLILYFKWSTLAMLALHAIEHWHDRSWSRFAGLKLYMLDGDVCPEVAEWIAKTLKETGGNGSLFLFKQGVIASSFPSVIHAGLDRIENCISEHFHS